MNRTANAVIAVCAFGIAGVALAQTPPPPKPTYQQDQPSQTQPDARYPNPSGQDRKPNEQPPKKSPADRQASAKQPSSSPRSADQEADNGAGKDVYRGSNAGKRADPNMGCTNPTDAAAARGQAQKPAGPPESRKPVCTTSGGDEATHPQARDQAKEK